MGIGDKLMAIGDAWNVHQRDPKGRKVAIGNGVSLDPTDMDLCYGLSDFLVTPQTFEGPDQHPWVISYPGCRPYIDYPTMRELLVRKGYRILKRRKYASRLGRYVWDLSYRPTPAPIVLTTQEENVYEEWKSKGRFVIFEPFIKPSAPVNKQWSVSKFQAAARLISQIAPVYQIAGQNSPVLGNFPVIRTSAFRDVFPYLKAASLYFGPEGGLHHATAAMGTKAIVLYGGFIAPQVTGYDSHVNLTGNALYACGVRNGACPHCQQAFDNISPEEVAEHAMKILQCA